MRWVSCSPSIHIDITVNFREYRFHIPIKSFREYSFTYVCYASEDSTCLTISNITARSLITEFKAGGCLMDTGE